MKTNIIRLIALALLLCALPSCAVAAPAPAPKTPKAAWVRVSVMQPNSTIRQGFTQNTSIEAIQRVVLYPRVTGRLEKLAVTKGDTVARGDLIAQLEHGEQNAQIRSAQADVERTRAEMSNARIELERYQRLNKEGFSTLQVLDSKDTSYRSAKAQYDAAQSELTRLTVTRDEYIISASIDGTVLNDYSLAPGAMLSTSTPVVELADLTTLKANFSIPEKRFYTVRPGMDVLLQLDAIPGEEFRAKVVRVDDYVDPQSRTAGVEARLKNSSTGNRFRPGMFGRVFVIEREVTDAYVVPMNALRHPRATTADNELTLRVGDVAKIVKVKTGIRQGVDVQITEGLAPGDQVITFGGNALIDGDPVELLQ